MSIIVYYFVLSLVHIMCRDKKFPRVCEICEKLESSLVIFQRADAQQEWAFSWRVKNSTLYSRVFIAPNVPYPHPYHGSWDESCTRPVQCVGSYEHVTRTKTSNPLVNSFVSCLATRYRASTRLLSKIISKLYSFRAFFYEFACTF